MYTMNSIVRFLLACIGATIIFGCLYRWLGLVFLPPTLAVGLIDSLPILMIVAFVLFFFNLAIAQKRASKVGETESADALLPRARYFVLAGIGLIVAAIFVAVGFASFGEYSGHDLTKLGGWVIAIMTMLGAILLAYKILRPANGRHK